MVIRKIVKRIKKQGRTSVIKKIKGVVPPNAYLLALPHLLLVVYPVAHTNRLELLGLDDLALALHHLDKVAHDVIELFCFREELLGRLLQSVLVLVLSVIKTSTTHGAQSGRNGTEIVLHNLNQS